MPTPIKVVELRDTAWVVEELALLSPAQLAKKLCELHSDESYCKQSSVDWVIKRHMSDAQRQKVKYQRVHRVSRISL